MKLEHSVRYDPPPADVCAMLTDPAFREKATWAQGSISVDTFDSGARAKLPLVHKLIEKLIADRLRDGWDTEHGVGVAWLAGDR